MALSASDLPAVYALPANSMSGDERVRKPAEAALGEFKSRPGFCSCLMEVITAKDLAPQVDVRLMASVYFKNSVNRYWRTRRDTPGISADEKAHLTHTLYLRLSSHASDLSALLLLWIFFFSAYKHVK
ncbi:importin beta SMX1-like [Eucalyptus grandis]|uniref:importin beta SMX1-like n=1 Tax=Eucalyptus grandis TaxID=71139 RepID=UPI00192EAC13|nr:importin beta SMX1-like [Eucalyptus grandis]